MLLALRSSYLLVREKFCWCHDTFAGSDGFFAIPVSDKHLCLMQHSPKGVWIAFTGSNFEFSDCLKVAKCILGADIQKHSSTRRKKEVESIPEYFVVSHLPASAYTHLCKYCQHTLNRVCRIADKILMCSYLTGTAQIHNTKKRCQQNEPFSCSSLLFAIRWPQKPLLFCTKRKLLIAQLDSHILSTWKVDTAGRLTSVEKNWWTHCQERKNPWNLFSNQNKFWLVKQFRRQDNPFSDQQRVHDCMSAFTDVR